MCKEYALSLNKSTQMCVRKVLWNWQADRFYCLGVLKMILFLTISQKVSRNLLFYSISPYVDKGTNLPLRNTSEMHR